MVYLKLPFSLVNKPRVAVTLRHVQCPSDTTLDLFALTFDPLAKPHSSLQDILCGCVLVSTASPVYFFPSLMHHSSVSQRNGRWEDMEE